MVSTIGQEDKENNTVQKEIRESGTNSGIGIGRCLRGGNVTKRKPRLCDIPLWMGDLTR